MYKNHLIYTLILLCSILASAQKQYADSAYAPPKFRPAYKNQSGPIVMIDESHHNFHTRKGRYSPFSKVLEIDGYNVKSFTGKTTVENLNQCEIFVIANALPDLSDKGWVAPTPSAFNKKEIKAIRKWVKQGGKLFLLADHMPMGGAAKDLAAAFGFTFYNSFSDNEKTKNKVELFAKSDGSLSQNILTGRSDSFFEVDSIATFTGQTFEIPKNATSILNCGEGWVSYLTKVAWQIDEHTKKLNSEGWSQGAYMHYGKGKLVFFGEAAMFSAQIAEIQGYTIKAGMNNDKTGKNNYKLLLNIIRWLDKEK